MMDNTFDSSTTASGTDYMSRDRYGMYRPTDDTDRSDTDGDASDNDDRQGPGPRLMGADTLLGNDVYNRNDESLGSIKEIMLDMSSGRVAYAVLSFGGFLGMNTKLFAVPWQALQLDTANHRFTLDVDRDRLKNAPGFDADRWPDMADQSWARDVHSFYGTTDRNRYDDETDGDLSSRGYDDGTATGSYDSSQANDRLATNRPNAPSPNSTSLL